MVLFSKLHYQVVSFYSHFDYKNQMKIDEKENNSQIKRPFLIITGMHRSGTSFLVRALNLAGVYLGSLDSIITHDLVPAKDNPRGHWENTKLLHLGEKTLSFSMLII